MKDQHIRKNTTITKDRWGVHESHCCINHGCKYGYEDCPVTLGILNQKYPCEICAFDKSDFPFHPNERRESLDRIIERHSMSKSIDWTKMGEEIWELFKENR